MRVFVSHIHEEAPFALVLKEWVESTFPGQCDVFVSSDHDDLPAGKKWLQEIDNALDESAAVITVCSPTSLARPWINFETGCAWIKRTPVIPICHSGLTREALPQPLSRFQALDFGEEMPRNLMQALAKVLQVERVPRIAYGEMFDELQQALPETVAEPEQGAPATSDTLEEIEQQILLTLAEANRDLESDQLAGRFQVKPAKMQYYLDRLCDLNYVYRNMSMMSPTTYSIGKEGRAYLVSRDLM